MPVKMPRFVEKLRYMILLGQITIDISYVFDKDGILERFFSFENLVHFLKIMMFLLHCSVIGLYNPSYLRGAAYRTIQSVLAKHHAANNNFGQRAVIQGIRDNPCNRTLPCFLSKLNLGIFILLSTEYLKVFMDIKSSIAFDWQNKKTLQSNLHRSCDETSRH